MNNLEALGEASKVLRLVAGSVLYRRMAGNIAVIVAIAVTTGLLAGALLLIGTYGAYLELVEHGFSAKAALMGIATIIAAVIAISIAAIVHYVRRIRSSLAPSGNFPDVRRIARAFVDGLTEPRGKDLKTPVHP